MKSKKNPLRLMQVNFALGEKQERRCERLVYKNANKTENTVIHFSDPLPGEAAPGFLRNM